MTDPAGLSPAKRALFERLKSRQVQASAIPPRSVTTPAPLSFAQERLWFLDRLDPGNAAYVVAHGLRFTGTLDTDVVRLALAHLVARHEVLRTTFAEIDGEPRQHIAANASVGYTRLDRSGLSPRDVDDAIATAASETFTTPFDLVRGPLFRLTDVVLGPDEHVLLFAMHHIISDATSLEQLVREFAIGCASLGSGVEPRLPALPIQFADYACWQRGWFTGSVRDAQLAYWTTQLAGLAPVDLPADRPRPAVQTTHGAALRTELPPDIVLNIRTLGQAHEATPFMTLLTGFVAWLSRYTGQTDIAVGSPVANRSRSETAQMVGLFANTIVLRVDCGGNPTVADLLRRTRDAVLDAHAHQDLPFEQLVEELQPPRDLSRNPLFQVFFIHRRHARDEHAFGTRALDLPSTTTKFDLTVTFEEAPDRMWSVLEYNTDLFEPETVARMSRHLTTLLGAMATHPTMRVADLPLLESRERDEILRQRPPDATDPRPSLPEAFARIAAEHPEQIAIVAGTERVAYRTLAERSARIAAILGARGVRAGDLVGMFLDRTPTLVEAALGIAQCGAAYVPLDPSFPAGRLRLMIEDARLSTIITTSDLAGALPAGAAALLVLDDEDSVAGSPAHAGYLSSEPQSARPDRDALAYAIYTSGSTGVPKGVQVSHGALANFLASMRAVPGFVPGDRLLAVTTFSFDIAGLELWLPLTTGGTVVLASRDETRDGRKLKDLIDREQPTILQATPSTWRLLLDAGWRNDERLRMLVGGEALPPDLARALLALSPDLWNMYGPTETTIWSTLHHVRGGSDASLIGLPIACTDVYVLDGRLEPVPYGVAGDLYIGGDGLARGYVGRPDLTADRFLPDPHATAAGQRMYRTGDIARLRPGGVLEYLGRSDDQIKLRGYRIELGDVEAAAAAHPGIEHAAAAIRPGLDGEPALFCWYVPSGATTDAGAIREFVRAQLPDYMVPTLFTPVDRLPLTLNGKVDRRALPTPALTRPARAIVAARTDAERRMLGIWRDVLRTETIGIDDDFFDLGGHSMLAARLLARVRQTFSVDVPLRALFETPTIAALCRAVTVLSEGGALETLTPSLRAELLADSQLDPAIRPDIGSQPVRTPTRPLLTGASGFLGAHLLAELLTTTTATVTCLVRCRDAEDGHRRLQETLEKYQTFRPEFADRIVAIPGDLEQPRLGLTREAFDDLSRAVDVVYHNGALVNFVLPYRQLRSANVAGTVEVITLACRHVLKPIHYVSTMDVLGAGFLTALEDDPLVQPEGLTHGYAQSKWVAERLVSEARDRGVPVAIYRPGRVVGHSRTGIWNTEDFACRAVRGSIELGVVPDVEPLDNMAPVDYVSAAIVSASRSPLALSHRALHAINPEYFAWSRLFDAMRRRGYVLDTVTYREWRRRLAASPDNALAPLLPLFPVPVDAELTTPVNGPAPALPQPTDRPAPHCDGMRTALQGTGVECPPLDAALWDRYFDFFTRTGYIAPVTP